MLKIHKGLKKKKKDKKHKRKYDDDLFDEEELDRYRKEHQQQLQQQGDEQSSSGDGSNHNKAQSLANSDEWQKFKALTAGIDCVLQKTQEDLDRIKSTSFFQRKPVPSEASKVPDNVHQSEEQYPNKADTDLTDTDYKDDHHPTHQTEDDFELDNEEDAEEEEEEEDIFNTSYVDAVASGELKLAYIPDSPTEELQEGCDPFDTSIADKFIVNNPKKRYLNLGCAVQVLSGKADSASATTTAVASSAAKRRIIRPVQLLLDSFDEDRSATTELVVPSLDSPVKTLLDEDPNAFGDNTPVCEVLPLPAVIPVVASVSETAQPIQKASNQSTITVPRIESLSLAEFEIQSSTTAPETIPFKQISIDSCGSIDDEFAELAQTRKSVVAVTTPTAPVVVTPSDPLAVSPISDPFDTSIADKLISDSKAQSQLLDHQNISVLSAIEDDDFDPRADDTILSALTEAPGTPSSPIFSPTSGPAATLDIIHAIIDTPTENTSDNLKEENEDVDDYDPFDTSHVAKLNAV